MRGNIFLFLGFSIFASTAFGYANPQCALPCSDLWVAKDCNYVDYCIENDWAKVPISSANDDVCDLCIEMVNEARAELNSGSTRDELIQVIEKTCDLYTLDAAKKICHSLATTLSDDLIKVLSSNMEPEAVCAIVKLCNRFNPETDHDAGIYIDDIRGDDGDNEVCDVCFRFFANARNQTVSKMQYDHIVKSFCSYVQYPDADCSALKKESYQNFNTSKWLTRFCRNVFSCPAENSFQQYSARPNEDPCNLCRSFYYNVQAVLMRTPDDKTAYVTNLLDICRNLFLSIDVCGEFAKSEEIYNYMSLNEYTLSDALCTYNCAKPSSRKFSVQKRNGFVNLTQGVSYSGKQLLTRGEQQVDELIRFIQDFLTRGENHENNPLGFSPNTKSEIIPSSMNNFNDEQIPEVPVQVQESEPRGELYQEHEIHGSLVQCSDCYVTLNAFFEYAKDKDRDELIDDMYYVCNSLSGRYQAFCRSTVIANRELLADIILNKPTVADACTALRFCDEIPESRKSIDFGDEGESEPYLPLAREDVLEVAEKSDCELCIGLSKYAELSWGHPSQVFNSISDQLCENTTNKASCREFVAMYWPQISEKAKEYASSSQLCQDIIPSCGGNAAVTTDVPTQGNPPRSESSVFRFIDQSVCEACKAEMTIYLEVYKYENDSNVIRESLEKACTLPGGKLRPNCRSVVFSKKDELAELLANRTEPGRACVQMKFCSTTSSRSELYGHLFQNFFFGEAYEGAALEELHCDVCSEFSDVVGNTLRGHPDMITSIIRNLCAKVPIHRTCSRLFERYRDNILEKSVSFFESEQVCYIIPLCTSKRSLGKTNGKPGICQTCQRSVKNLVTLFENRKDAATVETILSYACEELPYDRRERCETLVSDRKELISSIIEKKLSPQKACQELKYCAKLQMKPVYSDEEIDSSSVELAPAPPKKVPCNFCLLAVKMLIDQLDNNRTQEEIKKILDTMCDYFPAETRKSCEDMVDEYAEDLIDLIAKNFKPHEICYRLKACTKEEGRKVKNITSLLGDPHLFDMETNEVEKTPLMRSEGELIDTETDLKVKPAGKWFMSRLYAAVEECALCEALVGEIISHEEMQSKNYDFYVKAPSMCSMVPINKKDMCIKLAVSYGPSMINLLVDKKTDPDIVCLELAICEVNMRAGVHLPVAIDINPSPDDCTKGPSFWCASVENAKMCNTLVHCQELVWNNSEPPTNS